MGLLNEDKVQVTFRGDCFGQEIILTHGYTVIGPFPALTSVAQDLDTIIDDITAGVLTTFFPAYRACLGPQYTLRHVRAQKINALRSAYRQNDVTAVGTNVNACSVANDSACLTLRTDVATKHGISNKHIGPAPDGASAAGVLTDAYRALVQVLGTGMLTAFVPTGSGSLLQPSVWSGPAGAALFLTSRVTGLQSRVQRRRTVGVGS